MVWASPAALCVGVGEPCAPVNRCRARRSQVLASQSPRRAQLLRQVGLTAFDVVPSTFAEDLPKASFATPVDYVAETALRKCQEVAARVGGDAIVISADTIVVSACCAAAARRHCVGGPVGCR